MWARPGRVPGPPGLRPPGRRRRPPGESGLRVAKLLPPLLVQLEVVWTNVLPVDGPLHAEELRLHVIGEVLLFLHRPLQRVRNCPSFFFLMRNSMTAPSSSLVRLPGFPIFCRLFSLR